MSDALAAYLASQRNKKESKENKGQRLSNYHDFTRAYRALTGTKGPLTQEMGNVYYNLQANNPGQFNAIVQCGRELKQYAGKGPAAEAKILACTDTNGAYLSDEKYLVPVTNEDVLARRASYADRRSFPTSPCNLKSTKKADCRLDPSCAYVTRGTSTGLCRPKSRGPEFKGRSKKSPCRPELEGKACQEVGDGKTCSPLEGPLVHCRRTRVERKSAPARVPGSPEPDLANWNAYRTEQKRRAASSPAAARPRPRAPGAAGAAASPPAGEEQKAVVSAGGSSYDAEDEDMYDAGYNSPAYNKFRKSYGSPRNSSYGSPKSRNGW